MVKALQMRTLVPTPPARATPHAGKAAGASPKPGAGGAGKKLCAECRQPCTGLPLRCSGCKTTHYCSKDCQKKAWPSHREACKAPAGTASSSASPSGKPAASASPSTAASPASAAAVHTQGGLNQALEKVLEESAAGNTDKLESLFETSVLMFLRGDYRGAITQVRERPFLLPRPFKMLQLKSPKGHFHHGVHLLDALQWRLKEVLTSSSICPLS